RRRRVAAEARGVGDVGAEVGRPVVVDLHFAVQEERLVAVAGFVRRGGVEVERATAVVLHPEVFVGAAARDGGGQAERGTGDRVERTPVVAVDRNTQFRTPRAVAGEDHRAAVVREATDDVAAVAGDAEQDRGFIGRAPFRARVADGD